MSSGRGLQGRAQMYLWADPPHVGGATDILRCMDPGERKASIAAVFDRAADSYDRTGVEFFKIVGRRLVELAAPQPGERVLDLGCGRGAAALPAAEAVGSSGRVHATDLAPGMVAGVLDEAAASGLTNVTAEVGDAEAPEVPAAS